MLESTPRWYSYTTGFSNSRKVTDSMTSIVKSEAALEKYKEYQSFIYEHGQQLISVSNDYKSPEEIFELVEALPDTLAQKDALFDVLKRLNPNRKGIVSGQALSFHTDLRLYHGVGNDPNRPADLVPGSMYYSSGDLVGKEFIGTPLFIWEGRELQEKGDDGSSGKTLCLSNDRKMGGMFGECQKCRYLPFRPDASKDDIRCRNYINAFMLSQNGKEIVLVRFNKTSEGAGRQLIKFASRTPQLWTRWYSIKPAAQQSADKKMRWFTFTVETVTGTDGNVPTPLYPVCDALYCAAGRDFVYPAIARCYADASKDRTETTGGAATNVEVVTQETDKGFGYANINEDA